MVFNAAFFAHDVADQAEGRGGILDAPKPGTGLMVSGRWVGRSAELRPETSDARDLPRDLSPTPRPGIFLVGAAGIEVAPLRA